MTTRTKTSAPAGVWNAECQALQEKKSLSLSMHYAMKAYIECEGKPHY